MENRENPLLATGKAKRKLTVGAPGNVTPPIDNVIKAAKRNEAQGYDAIWWFDHLMSWWPQSIWDLTPLQKFQKSPHINLDAVATMAAAGTHTEYAMLGTSVTDPRRRPPAMLAQEFLTLDHITKGRVILGIGAGEQCNLGPYSIDYSKPIGHLEEAIKVIRLLWENDQPVDFDGEFYKLHGAINNLPPYRPGRFPPIWMGGFAPRTIRVIGQLADGWLPPLTFTLEEYKQRVASMRQSAQQAGRNPDDITQGLWVYTIIDDSHEECHRMLDALMIRATLLPLNAEYFTSRGFHHPLGDNTVGIHELIPSLMSRETVVEACKKMPFEILHEKIVHGTPDDIAAHVKPFIDAGVSHIAAQNITFAADESKLSTSFRMLADAVKAIKALGQS